MHLQLHTEQFQMNLLNQRRNSHTFGKQGKNPHQNRWEAERQFYHKPHLGTATYNWEETLTPELLLSEQRIWTATSASQLLRPASKMRPSNPQLWKSMKLDCIHETHRTGQTEKQLLKGSSRPTLLPPLQGAQHRGSLIETAVKGAGHTQIMRKGTAAWMQWRLAGGGWKSRWLWEQSGHWPYLIIPSL